MSETKAMFMDRLLTESGGRHYHEAIEEAVKTAYGIDLSQVPTLAGADAGNRGRPQEPENASAALRKAGEKGLLKMDGPSARVFINQLCGVNLDAISALEGAGIALFSKGQWILQNKDDFIEVRTSEGDREVIISATEEFTQKNGNADLPLALREALLKLGYQAAPDGSGSFLFASSDGKAVPDAFKGATISAIMGFLKP